MAKQSFLDRLNNRTVAELEEELGKLYQGAFEEATDAASKYWSGWDEVVNGETIHHNSFQERYDKTLQLYQDGKIDETRWQQWVVAQKGRGQTLDTMADIMAGRMSNANEVAAAYINGETPKIYAEASNFESFCIEKKYSADMRTVMVDDRALEELATNKNHSEFKTLSTNPQRDYQWNYDRIQTAMQTGLLRGESMSDITKRFLQVMGTNETAARRNARTAVGSALNAGIQNSMERAEELGVEVEKEWYAHHDARTRDSHAYLDGVRVKVKEKFPNGLLYPKDPAGAPAEVYNCRCRLIGADSDIEARSRNTVKSYQKWKEDREAGLVGANDNEQWYRYKEVLGDEIPDTLEGFANMKYISSEMWYDMKERYRIVNSYNIDSGTLTNDQIVDMHKMAVYEKKHQFTGRFKNGNVAIMDFDGGIHIANSRVHHLDNSDFGFVNYKGVKSTLVGDTEEPMFKTFVVGKHDRVVDTESRLFEYAANKINDSKPHVINMISEKCMCESCRGVMRQFKSKFPNVEVNVISNKKERDKINRGQPFKYFR